MSKVITIRCKAFSTESARAYKIDVTENKEFRVFDDIAGHYTRNHALSDAAKRRAWRLTYGPGN